MKERKEKRSIVVFISYKKSYSGKLKMPLDGVRIERIEAQLPNVWPRSRGVKPYLKEKSEMELLVLIM